MNNKFLKQEEEFLADIEIDYVPLYDVVRLFSGYSKLIPSEEEFLQALDFLSYLLNKYEGRIRYYIGPGVRQIKKPVESFVTWLKEIWYSGKYRKVDRSVWFDLD